MKLRAAVIGCGNIAWKNSEVFTQWPVTHMAAYATLDHTEVVAVADIAATSASSCASHWNVPAVYTDYRQLLRSEQVDIISICTPYETHAQIIRDAVAAGIRYIWCEKPFCNSLEDARQVTQLCNEQNVRLAVNFQRRHDPLHQFVKNNLQDLVGDVAKVMLTYAGGITNNGSHAFDLLRYYFGEIKSVTATQDQARSDPNLTVSCHFASGLRGILTSITIPQHSIFTLTIYGKKAQLDLINQPHLGYDYRYLPYVPSATIPSVTRAKVMSDAIFPVFSRNILSVALENLIATKQNIVNSAENGIAALELVNASLISAKDRATITLPCTNLMPLPKLYGVVQTWTKT